MYSKKKEDLFDLLRAYHEIPTPAGLTSGRVQSCARELEVLKEHIMTMVFGLVRGTIPFRDWKPELKKLRAKTKPAPGDSTPDRSELEVIYAKVLKLEEIVQNAETEPNPR